MDESRILDKLDDHTEKLTELGATMKLYMQNQNELNASLANGVKDLGSEVVRMKLSEAGNPHRCEDAIKLHEESAWSHNPKKALTLAGAIIGIVESVRGFLHK